MAVPEARAQVAEGLNARVNVIDVTAKAIPLDASDPELRRVGELIYRGGLRIASSDRRLGGLSALLVLARGRTFICVSDRGYWISGTLGYDDNGDLASISGVTIEPFIGPAGQWLTMSPWRDAESLGLRRDNSVVVSFEDAHRLWTYAGRGSRPNRIPTPPRLYRAPRNGGVEALTVLPDDRIFALTEELGTDDGVQGWISSPTGNWISISYATDGGYRPTGAATVPDAGVLVLERRFPPLGVRLRRVPGQALSPSAVRGEQVVQAREIATFTPTMTMDNMEGVDVVVTADGRRMVYIVSDDNFSALQSTLLMMFEWPDGQRASVPGGDGGAPAKPSGN